MVVVGPARRYAARMVTIRIAVPDDREALGRYGAALLHQHHDADAARFIHVEHPEEGYGRYLASQIGGEHTQVWVAVLDGAVVGYLFAHVEGANWMDLRGPSGVIEDVFVDASARGRGAGRGLVRTALDWIGQQGRRQVVLKTKTHNEHAKRLFESFGFRPTMIEMTVELPGPQAPS